MTQNTDFETLRPQLRGDLLLPDSPGYDDSRTLWNAMIDRRPAVVVRALGVGDVVAAVTFARENDVDLCIKGGGHNIAGLAVADGALLLDMSRMRGVMVDVPGKVVRAQAGCILGDVDRETQLHGQAAVMGFVSETGIAGLTLGGGFGYLSRRFGWTSDNVQAMEMVTAEGKVVTASETENPDLFWGLRGGGGNFGVVTRIDYKLYPVGPEIIGGAIAWPADRAPEVMAMYEDLMKDAPAEFAAVTVYRPAPPAPWLPEEIHGKPVLVMIVCDTGDDRKAAEKRLARIREVDSPVGDVLGPRPLTVQQAMLDPTQPKGRRYYWKSEYLPGLSGELFEKYIEHSKKLPSPHSAMIIFPVGAQGTRPAADHSAVGNRDANYVLNITAAWESPADDDACISWARDTWSDMRSFSTGGTYLNFLTEEEGADRVKDALGDNLDRLIEIKTKWDPKNLFRMNKNIAPKG